MNFGHTSRTGSSVAALGHTAENAPCFVETGTGKKLRGPPARRSACSTFSRRTPRSQSGGATPRPGGSSAACLCRRNPHPRPLGGPGLWRPTANGLAGGGQPPLYPPHDAKKARRRAPSGFAGELSDLADGIDWMTPCCRGCRLRRRIGRRIGGGCRLRGRCGHFLRRNDAKGREAKESSKLRLC